MKVQLFMLLFVLGYIQCRKIYAPIDKNANIAFINMEGGQPAQPRPGTDTGPGAQPGQPAQTPPKPAQPVPTPAKPAQSPTPTPKSVQTPITFKPIPVTTKPLPIPAKPVVSNSKPPVHVNPAQGPTTTPIPGSVKHLINYYDSQGKQSAIRPYSYSQAVKQGK